MTSTGIDLGIGAWAAQRLRSFSELLLNPADLAAIAQLRAASVSESRIGSLYPFELSAFRPALDGIAQSKAARDAIVPEIRANSPENTLWLNIPWEARPKLDFTPNAYTDQQLLVERMLILVIALHTLRGWPFESLRARLMLNGKAPEELNAQVLERIFATVDGSLDRLLQAFSSVV